ncbi:methionine--tRNA ligase [Candidatus Woesearchaeota archaeon]|nr:methionine--tRNA ligase [Candidatus Woesearchaeota archaeon]
MKKERRLVTAALPYVNNIPHLGNIVGSHLPADIFARYCRLNKYDTIFIGGTDEHGTPIEVAAIKNNTTPQKLADFYYKKHKEIYDWFNFSYDNFSRTSKEIHHKTTQEFLKKVYANGYIKKGELEIPYCKNCNIYLADRYIEGICPVCSYQNARGDQCEKCGKILDPIDLHKPRCVICNKDNIIFRKVKHLFLDLTKLSKRLEKWINTNKVWRQQVKSIALAWIKEGLKPRCITRNLKWGIKVPFKGYEELVYYVWAEAAIGYISSTKEWNKNKWEDYWKGKNSKIYHFIGKDNIPFHTILFPAELIAHGGYNLPYNVVGLQYLNYEGGKFSKSKQHGVFFF